MPPVPEYLSRVGTGARARLLCTVLFCTSGVFHLVKTVLKMYFIDKNNDITHNGSGKLVMRCLVATAVAAALTVTTATVFEIDDDDDDNDSTMCLFAVLYREYIIILADNVDRDAATMMVV
jgi:hypothetical protein